MNLLEATLPMSRPAQKRLPWQDRWTQPTVPQLLGPVEETRRKLVENLITHIEAFEGVERDVVWYGASWKWTLEFRLKLNEGEDGEVLAYIVPSPQAPIVCIPLTEEVITKIPIRRLNRYIRDVLRSCKRAVDLHWAMWTPMNNVELEQLVDLIKRKHKLLRAAEQQSGE